jgi:hypothetical protein
MRYVIALGCHYQLIDPQRATYLNGGYTVLINHCANAKQWQATIVRLGDSRRALKDIISRWLMHYVRAPLLRLML